MTDIGTRNYAELRGVLNTAPVFSHESRAERFFTFPLETRRLSGVTDSINIIAREHLLQNTQIGEGSKVLVSGELRSFNNKHKEGSKLVITVFAREISFDDEPDENAVELIGSLCKPTNLRTTPMGREICDLMLAVSRRYGRTDYLPCICWGIQAQRAALWDVGDVVRLSGRIQSREYIKMIDGEPIPRTAFEVSVIEIERI